MRKTLVFLILGVVVLFGLIQLIPYGHDHSNPPIVNEPAWNNPETRALAVRACFDCHSNETTWPWYSNFAPVSWLIQRDVEQGRKRLNFSDWMAGRTAGREIGHVIQEGEMPPVYYVLMHPDARLTDADKQLLVQGLQDSPGTR